MTTITTTSISCNETPKDDNFRIIKQKGKKSCSVCCSGDHNKRTCPSAVKRESIKISTKKNQGVHKQKISEREKRLRREKERREEEWFESIGNQWNNRADYEDFVKDPQAYTDNLMEGREPFTVDSAWPYFSHCGADCDHEVLEDLVAHTTDPEHDEHLYGPPKYWMYYTTTNNTSNVEVSEFIDAYYYLGDAQDDKAIKESEDSNVEVTIELKPRFWFDFQNWIVKSCEP